MTPINWQILERLLVQSNYSEAKTVKLVNGFREGFDLGYAGPVCRQSLSNNLPFTVGNRTILWNKLMKEVRLGRVAGPFDVIPFRNYVQSPIGLVPKDNGTQTRLIFHLSYNFDDYNSINAYTPSELCTVRYNDLDTAIKSCLYQLRLEGSNSLWFGKSDAQSAFRVVPLLRKCWNLLIMKAYCPKTGVLQYFVDKCLPFGASISCAIFQDVSDALRHILQFRTAVRIPHNRAINNYLDDFLFITTVMRLCNWLIQKFLDLCQEVGMPINMSKTEWASQLIVFLGILLNGVSFTITVPEEKRIRAVEMLNFLLSKKESHDQATPGVMWLPEFPCARQCSLAEHF